MTRHWYELPAALPADCPEPDCPYSVNACPGHAPAATIYCRVRPLDDAGLARQEGECRAYCQRQGWAVREIFSDIGGTGDASRPGFERLLASKPDAIVVWNTDRLVRSPRELLRVIDLGVNVYAVNGGSVDLSTATGRAVARTVATWAEFEAEGAAQ